ncbi:DUF1205 domain-containing protein [Dactylosporangium fulvum]|uniref:DUF1205 domain-containing protein n=1 Tax=Dactylosporangium fulvum TaxID=53359 RepID=A0ABY5WAH9_9ACTN|nr:nucleotide disphospho-sugar-binding domain-containing protein [Dactylosporangium fulvum]UWP86116.1 DUF1205 domain-containing protein [Dactylosporangium fulvum]
MRILVVAPLASTHFTPLIPLCWAFRAGGHEVLVAAPPDLVPTARSAGLSTIVIGDAARLLDTIGENVTPDMYPAEAFGDRTSHWGRQVWELSTLHQVSYAVEHVEEYLAFADEWKPDIVLYDQLTLIGRIAGVVLGAVSVSHRWGVDPTAGPYEERVRRDLAAVCRRFKLDELPAPDVIVDPCPPSLQVEDAPPGQPMRYVPFNGTGTLPDWARRRAAGRRICICLGGSLLDVTGPAPLRRVIEAARAVPDAEVVLAITPANRRLVDDLPDDLRVVESLPLQLFLPTCDLVVGSGGSGTGLTATSMGIPQLVVPQWFDQFDYGRRLAAAGAGLNLPGRDQQSDPAVIREAAETLLGDSSFSTAVQKLRTEIESAPSPIEVAARLTSMVR